MSNPSPVTTDVAIYEYVMAKLQESKGRWPQVARDTGISKATIVKIAQRIVKDPGVSFIERLARYFREQEASRAA